MSATGQQSAPANATPAAASGRGTDEDYSTQDQVKVFSHEGDGENTEHLNSMDLHDIKTELERDAEAEKAETPKSAADVSTSPTFNSAGSNSIAITTSGLPQASIRPVIHHPTAMVYANGSAVPFMIPPFAAAGGSPLYPVMRPVKVESDWKVSQSSTGQLSIPTYSYPAGFLPVDQNGLRPAAYPFMAIPSQYVTPYQAQFTALGQAVAPNATVQPNSGGMIAQPVKEKRPHIKKPLNAFMLFMKQKRADVIKECTLKESAAINQILGKMWHALDRSEQAKYYEMAREERAKHMQMYPGWSARDNYAIHKKRRKRKVKQADSKGEEYPEETDKKMQDNESGLVKLLPLTACSVPPPPVSSPLKTTATSNPHTDDEEVDLNNRKCRARFGLDQQHMWCSPCRRKKKCIRFSVDDDDHAMKDVTSEVDDDDVIITPSGLTETALVLSEPTEAEKQLPPHLLRHDVALPLQTIPT